MIVAARFASHEVEFFHRCGLVKLVRPKHDLPERQASARPVHGPRSSPNSRLYPLRNIHRELKRGGRFEPGNLWSQTGARAFDEGEQLPLERFLLLDLDLGTLDSAADLAINFASLVLVIEREICVFLEDANLPHSLGTDSTRGDVGHAAILETKPRVGDVFAPTQDRHADRIDRLHGRPDEMQNDFRVVDHEIEHDADVGAAIWKRRKAMRFDETRMGQARFERAQARD